MGLDAGPDVVARLALHIERVLEANERFNLTSIDAADAVSLHVLDSCAAACALADAPAGQFADLGSGAGYPGIPLSLVSGRPVSLVESVGKKAAFLNEMTRELRLNATVHGIRAEDLALAHREEFAAVTARALSALPSLVELAAPLLMRDGLLVCLKGRPAPEEMRAGDATAALCGMGAGRLVSLYVPGVDAARCVVLYRRTGRPRLKLPRRVGLAQKSPLA